MRKPLLLLSLILALHSAYGMSPQRKRILFGNDPLSRGLTFRAPLKSSLTVLKSSGNGTPTYTRASSGTYVDATGTVQTATSGNARYDYAASGQTKPGVLVEAQATNIILQSQTLTTAPWTNNGLTITGGQASPDGGTSAWSLNDTSAVAYQKTTQSVTVANDSTTYTISVYVLKTSAGSAPTFGINAALTGGTGVSMISRLFTDTGTVTTGDKVVSVGSWWRLSHSITNNSSGNTVLTIDVYPAASTNGSLVDNAAATGSNTLWGAQLETGSVPTSYIATTSATVTRIADSLTYPIAGNATSAQGSISVWVNLKKTSTDGYIAVNIGFDSNLNSCRIESDGAGGLPLFRIGDGTVRTTLTSSVATATGAWSHEVATWGPSGATLYQNGVLVASTTTATGGFALKSTVVIGSIGTVEYLNNPLRDLRIYSRVLSASEVSALYNLEK